MGYSEQNQRQLRVGEQIRHILSELVRDCFFDDPALDKVNSLTISEVRISPDLKNATVYVVPLGADDFESDKVFIRALNKVSSYFRREIGRKIYLKYTPRLRFEKDTSFIKAVHINNLLADDRVKKDILKPNEDDIISSSGTEG